MSLVIICCVSFIASLFSLHFADGCGGVDKNRSKRDPSKHKHVMATKRALPITPSQCERFGRRLSPFRLSLRYDFRLFLCWLRNSSPAASLSAKVYLCFANTEMSKFVFLICTCSFLYWAGQVWGGLDLWCL